MFGAAILNLATTDVVAVYFDKHKEKVYAGLFTFFSIGMVVGPASLEHLAEVISYKYAMLIRSLIYLLVLPTALIYRGPCQLTSTVNKNKDQHGNINDSLKLDRNNTAIDNSESNTHIDDMPTCDGQEQNTMQDSKAATLPVAETKEKKRFVLASHLHVLKDYVFILILIYFLFGSIGENTFYALAVELSVSVDVLTFHQGGIGITITSVSLVVGCIVVSIMSHWELDRMALAIFSLFLLGLTQIFMGVANTLPTTYAAWIAFGFVEGLYVNNIIVWVAVHFDEPKYFTIRISHVFFMIGVGSLLGPLVVGYFVEATAMEYGFYFLSIYPIVGSLIILPIWIREKIKRRNEITTDKPVHHDLNEIEIHGPVAIGHL